MRIIKATNYGVRTVIQVVLNPEDPEWVHVFGLPWRDGNGEITHDSHGEVVLVTSPVVDPEETGESCFNCRYNWIVREVIFDGDAQFIEPPGEELRRRTDAEFALLVFEELAVPVLPEPMAALVGLESVN